MGKLTKQSKYSLSSEHIEGKIHFIRGRRVMLDRDLAKLYGVPAKRLNEQVRRNIKRFPEDFMFRLTEEEVGSLRSQIATLKRGQHSKYLPYVFTEQGVAMLSSVLNSDRAIEVNILIMRTFTKLREMMLSHKDLALKIKRLEHKFEEHDQNFQIVFTAIKKLLEVPRKPKRRIGFHSH